MNNSFNYDPVKEEIAGLKGKEMKVVLDFIVGFMKNNNNRIPTKNEFYTQFKSPKEQKIFFGKILERLGRKRDTTAYESWISFFLKYYDSNTDDRYELIEEVYKCI